MVGRALRPYPNKEYARIIDLGGNWERHGLPDCDRVWTLDGVESFKQEQSKKLQRGADGEIEEITSDLTPSDIQLQEITRYRESYSQYWNYVLDRLFREQSMKAYKVGWIAIKLRKMKPPLNVWQAAGERLGYHPNWANRRFESQ
jgi:superfamily II DNA or RNA helicase